MNNCVVKLASFQALLPAAPWCWLQGFQALIDVSLHFYQNIWGWWWGGIRAPNARPSIPSSELQPEASVFDLLCLLSERLLPSCLELSDIRSVILCPSTKRHLSISSSHGTAHSTMMMLGQKSFAIISWANFRCTCRSVLTSHLPPGERKYYSLVLCGPLPQCRMNWIPCCDVAGLALFALQDFGQLLRYPVMVPSVTANLDLERMGFKLGFGELQGWHVSSAPNQRWTFRGAGKVSYFVLIRKLSLAWTAFIWWSTFCVRLAQMRSICPVDPGSPLWSCRIPLPSKTRAKFGEVTVQMNHCILIPIHFIYCDTKRIIVLSLAPAWLFRNCSTSRRTKCVKKEISHLWSFNCKTRKMLQH